MMNMTLQALLLRKRTHATRKRLEKHYHDLVQKVASHMASSDLWSFLCFSPMASVKVKRQLSNQAFHTPIQ